MLLTGHTAWWRGRVVVLVGIVLVALNLRIAVAAVSPILDAVRVDVALSPTLAGLLGTIPVASFALFGSLAPMVSRRLGLEPTLVVATLVSVLGEVARSTATTPAGFLGWSVIALAGMGMGNVLLPPLVKRYFPDRIGPVTAVYSVAMSFSTAIPPLLAVPLANRLGWRVALGSWGVVGVVAALPWLAVVVRSTPGTAARAACGAARSAPSHCCSRSSTCGPARRPVPSRSRASRRGWATRSRPSARCSSVSSTPRRAAGSCRSGCSSAPSRCSSRRAGSRAGPPCSRTRGADEGRRRLATLVR